MFSDGEYQVSPHGHVFYTELTEEGRVHAIYLSHALTLRQAESIARLLNWCQAMRDLEHAQAVAEDARQYLTPALLADLPKPE